jgi:hypothetical protein
LDGYGIRSKYILETQLRLGMSPLALTSPHHAIETGSVATASPEVIHGIHYHRTPLRGTLLSRTARRLPYWRERDLSGSLCCAIERLLAAGAVVLLFTLIGALLLFQARRDVSALQGELKALRVEVRRSQVLQDRGAVLRARAELQALRQTLPPDLAPEIDKADGILGGIDARLKASP